MTIQGCDQTLVNHPNNPKKMKSSLKSTLTALLLTSGIVISGAKGAEVVNLTPVVENVTAAQVDGTKHLEVFFDLTVADNHPCQITVKWSTDNGETYPLTAVAVTGDAGPGIAPGTGKKVIWDMGVDWDNQFTQTGRIQIIASREPIDMSTGDNSQTGDTIPTDPQ
jgi:hypothetical protein